MRQTPECPAKNIFWKVDNQSLTLFLKTYLSNEPLLLLANFSGPWPRTKILNWWDVRLNFVLPNISLTIIASITPRVQRIVPSMVESTESTALLLLRANRWWFGYHWFTWYRGIVTILWWVREIICRVNLDERVLGVKDPLGITRQLFDSVPN